MKYTIAFILSQNGVGSAGSTGRGEANLLTCGSHTVVEYLREENRVLREQLGKRRLRLTDPQRARLAPWGLATNAEMSSAATRATCALSPAAEAHLGKLVAARRWLSARSIDRIIKVARTVADLADAPQIDRPHLAEAAGYRAFDREGVAPPAARA